ncbi:MAG: hypothetical protein IBJ10_08860 [Phycisphaerales bacterium]|nr:hypothetical protein [Phycisphaerales bacterium]
MSEQSKSWASVGVVAALAGVAGGLGGAPASAQPVSVRWEASALPFTPLHSYASGSYGNGKVFVTGISGQGLHFLIQGHGETVAFPLSVYSDKIYVLDESSGQLFTGGTAHLSASLRDRLRVTNSAQVQFGNTLYIYGGYGPVEGVSEWYTYASVVAVDLAAVDAAVRAGQPVPEAAFNVMASGASQVAGGNLVRMGDKFALVGGSNFEGDYGLGFNNPQIFTNTYSDSVHVFDSTVSMTTPIETFVDPYWLHRRDMQALPITLGMGEGSRYGFSAPGGVFNAVFPWENPLVYGLGDTEVTTDVKFIQKMNQYEGAHVSLYSASTGDNRLILMGGLTFQVYDDFFGEWYYDFTVPWSDTITQLTVNSGGAFVADSEIFVGSMPLPMSNGRFHVASNIPQNENHQILLDQVPHNEHLIGRVYGGLAADSASAEPPTWASSVVHNVYMAVGVRGDVNKDGVVNFADLNILLGQYNQSGALSADMNLDGTVNFADLNVVLSNFNSTTPG